MPLQLSYPRLASKQAACIAGQIVAVDRGAGL